MFAGLSSWGGCGGIDRVMAVDDLSDEELYAKVSDRLIRFAATIVGPADAEDVMTEGVVAAMRSRRWTRVDDRVAYLYRCVLNAGRMHLRASGRRHRREDRVWRESHHQTSADPAWGTVASEVRSVVSSLSTRQRAVVYLTYWEDLDEATTARLLGVSVGSVRQHLHRARHNIGRQLDATI